jgi:hypothetical protein
MKKLFVLASCLLIISAGSMAQSDTSIPVRISSLDAASSPDFNKLIWRTACSLDYASFQVLRSYDGVNYSMIHEFSADRFRCQQPFDYADSAANQLAGRIFYRLSVGDLDGRVYNSKIVSIITRGEGMEINSLLPNIVSGSASISISSSKKDNIMMAVVDAQGRVFQTMKATLSKGVNNLALNASALQQGSYWLKVTNSNNETKLVRFVKN